MLPLLTFIALLSSVFFLADLGTSTLALVPTHWFLQTEPSMLHSAPVRGYCAGRHQYVFRTMQLAQLHTFCNNSSYTLCGAGIFDRIRQSISEVLIPLEKSASLLFLPVILQSLDPATDVPEQVLVSVNEDHCRTLWVGSIPRSMIDCDIGVAADRLRGLFSRFGTVAAPSECVSLSCHKISQSFEKETPIVRAGQISHNPQEGIRVRQLVLGVV